MLRVAILGRDQARVSPKAQLLQLDRVYGSAAPKRSHLAEHISERIGGSGYRHNQPVRSVVAFGTAPALLCG